MENIVSNAERRALVTGEEEIVPRIGDIYAALPAITGKIELEYEGELVGGHTIARELIRRAADATFQDRAGGLNTDDIIMWFDAGVRCRSQMMSKRLLQSADSTRSRIDGSRRDDWPRRDG
jgi:magnesium chelatase subunit I